MKSYEHELEKMPELLQTLENTREKMKKELGNFWSGPDVKIEKEMVAEPGYYPFCANVTLGKENFPPLENLNSGVFKMLKQSMRSRYAQAGIEVFFPMFGLTQEDMEKINRGEKISVPVSVSNKGLRPVKISGDILRFYWLDYEKLLKGENLSKTVNENLKVNGEYGENWAFTDKEGNILKQDEITDETMSVRLFLNKKNRFYIPESKEPLEISSRQDLENALKIIPDNLNPDFKITETSKVCFKDIAGEIVTAYHDGSGAHHITSPFIDPGFGCPDGKPIRAELSGKEHPDFIEIFIFKTNEKKEDN